MAPDSENGAVWINQDAWFSLGKFNPGRQDTYDLHTNGNGVYVLVLEGGAESVAADRKGRVGEHWSARPGSNYSEPSASPPMNHVKSVRRVMEELALEYADTIEQLDEFAEG